MHHKAHLEVRGHLFPPSGCWVLNPPPQAWRQAISAPTEPPNWPSIVLDFHEKGEDHSPMEKVIVDLDLRTGFKVIWQQHHWGRYLAELIDLVKHKEGGREKLGLGESQERASQSSSNKTGYTSAGSKRRVLPHLLPKNCCQPPSHSHPHGTSCSQQPLYIWQALQATQDYF